MATNNVINQIGVIPAFSYYSNAVQANVTGDGTTYIVQFPNKIYDVTSSFDGTSTFTAPLTGPYQFTVDLFLSGLNASMTGTYGWLATTAYLYQIHGSDTAVSRNPAGRFNIHADIQIFMTHGDTAYVGLQVSGSTKIVQLAGGISFGNFIPVFSGYMITGY